MAVYGGVNLFCDIWLDYLSDCLFFEVSILSVDAKDSLATPTKSEISY